MENIENNKNNQNEQSTSSREIEKAYRYTHPKQTKLSVICNSRNIQDRPLYKLHIELQYGDYVLFQEDVEALGFVRGEEIDYI